jgi:hypothetical protein
MSALYFRGFLMEANTNSATKVLNVRDADTNSLHAFTGGPSANNISHNGQSQIEYTFTTPFVAHLCREEPGNDNIPWQKFGITWLTDPWPELSTEASSWMDLGTPGSKYVTSVVLPMDTGNNNASFNFKTSDGNNATLGPFLTPPAVKTPVPMPFTTPFVFHEVQVRAQNNARAWYSEMLWNFEQWPERISESSFWTNLGAQGAKYITSVVVPVENGNGNTTIRFTSPLGDTQAFGNINTPVNVKTPVPLAFTTPFVEEEIQVSQVGSAARIWWKEAKWTFEPWPERISESSFWTNCGAVGAKYIRGIVVPMENSNGSTTITFTAPSGQSQSFPGINTPVNIKTPIPLAFTTPFIEEEIQVSQVGSPARIWWKEARWDFEPWPELIDEASPWMNVLEGGAAAFLQGFLIPVEAGGNPIQLSLLTDISPTPIPLTAIRQPLANVKTPIPYSLPAPVFCHQYQIIPSAPCRVWWPGIKVFAEATPEQAFSWITQPTAHGQSGYHSILRIEASYSATAEVDLNITTFDGTAPAAISLPSTGGAKQRILLTPTFNKGQLFTYSGTSNAAFQMFLAEWVFWVAQWGRKGPAIPYRMMGGAFDDKAGV